MSFLWSRQHTKDRLLCIPNGAGETEKRKKKKKNLAHLQSGTNRIIQEMAAVCTGAAKIRLLLKTQWAGVTVFWCSLEKQLLGKRPRGRQTGVLLAPAGR